MHDLPWLRVDLGVVLTGLKLRERLERGAGELWPEEQCLKAGDDRVAAEDGHEPGHARSRQPSGAPAAAHPQRGKVRNRAHEAVRELVPVAADLRHAQLPRRQRLPHPRQLLAEAPLGHPRRDRVAVDRSEDVEPERPLLAGP